MATVPKYRASLSDFFFFKPFECFRIRKRSNTPPSRQPGFELELGLGSSFFVLAPLTGHGSIGLDIFVFTINCQRNTTTRPSKVPATSLPVTSYQISTTQSASRSRRYREMRMQDARRSDTLEIAQCLEFGVKRMHASSFHIRVLHPVCWMEHDQHHPCH